jgi:hypothetical protein
LKFTPKGPSPGSTPKQNIRWFVRAITGLDPDAAPQRLATCDRRGAVRFGELTAHASTHEFELWIPAELSDLASIERAVYRELREHLNQPRASLPGPRRAPRSLRMGEKPGRGTEVISQRVNGLRTCMYGVPAGWANRTAAMVAGEARGWSWRHYWVGFAVGVGLTVAGLLVLIWPGLGVFG